jgi:hypothetical protein
MSITLSQVCPNCHKVPQADEWIALPESPGLHVFHVGKRTGKFLHWEPIYIGTHAEPLYDERLSWEGKSDKMTQVTSHIIGNRDSTYAGILFYSEVDDVQNSGDVAEKQFTFYVRKK